MIRRPRRLWPFYIWWILICGVLFVALLGAEDPSRPAGRIQSIEAGMRARQFLLRNDAARYGSYEVVHVARARKGEGGDRDRWIVLLDRVPHSGLAAAMVVELDLVSGELLTIRTPEPRPVSSPAR